MVSNIRAEEWYRSGKGDPAHDGDCLLFYMFRYPSKHPDLLTYRESDEGKAEVEEVRGKQGSWRSQETVFLEGDRQVLIFHQCRPFAAEFRQSLARTTRGYSPQLYAEELTRPLKDRDAATCGQVSNRYLKRQTYRPSQCSGTFQIGTWSVTSCRITMDS